MKKLEELGISPAPWNVDDEDVRDSRGFGVVYSYDCSYLHGADAKFIAASPKMYETEYNLVEIVERLMNAFSGL